MKVENGFWRHAQICAITLFIASPAYAGVYVDNALGDVAVSQLIKVANPQPTQLLFEFDTGDKINARATKYVKPMITEAAKATGVVGDVSEMPVSSGARLTVVMTDIGDKNAASKGFATGLTLGLAGTVVADNYDFVIRYTPGDGRETIERTVHHRIYMKIGLANPPANATKFAKVEDAVRTIVRQALSHGLNEIAADPHFAAAPAPVAIAKPPFSSAVTAAPAPAMTASASGATK